MNGDVKLGENATPYMYWDNQWIPICGHYFWDNQEGASLFCKKIGYSKGSISRKHGKYPQDSFRIGKCNAGDDWSSCKGGCNGYTIGGACANGASCDKEQHVKIEITCEGWDGKTTKSCDGNIIYSNHYNLAVKYFFYENLQSTY